MYSEKIKFEGSSTNGGSALVNEARPFTPSNAYTLKVPSLFKEISASPWIELNESASSPIRGDSDTIVGAVASEIS